MNKLWVVICLFASTTSALPAEPIVLFGGSMGFASQDTVAMHPWSATSLGLFEQAYFDLAGSFGLYNAATIGFIVASQDNGVALDPGQYQTLSLNILLGIGYQMAFAPSLIAVAGAGVYFGSSSLNSVNDTLSSYQAGGVGAGVGISLLYSLTFNWGIGANVNAAYYFTIPGEVAPTMSPSGISVFGGIGITFFYKSTREFGPGVSRL